MATIHFIDGEKGGVGKSLFARVMVQYCIDRQLSHVLVEADRSNPDVGEVYPEGCERAIFSEAERKAYDADRIFDLAIKTPVIVNLPAQVFPAVTDWIERNGVLEMGSQHGVSICKWFICTGGYDSVQLFIQSLKRFEGQVQHVFVRNWGLCDDWSHLDSREELQQLLAKQKVPVLDFPKFSYRERDHLDAKRIPFSEGRESSELGVLGKQRLHTFLRSAYQAIDQVNIWKLSSSEVSSSKGTAIDANGISAEAGEADTKAVEPATSSSKSRSSKRSS
jgi:hypothetical protein